eukprot:TRINITY_DN95318_c0_g1_i1.p1 TRINITY_DN95318_c0_g1~~TRINITY_DN95318_c0_g1_i1.p1  ORF type:complete len:106 (-),score=9.40 TRINITY_DN95318_c0_g1_i1:67-384(-)
MKVRAKSISFSTGANWLMNYIVAQTFLSLSISISTDRACPAGHPNGVFWLFGIIGLIGLVGFAFTLPETKGKSLEEISELFNYEGEEVSSSSTDDANESSDESDS